jgi:hypothetical protein
LAYRGGRFPELLKPNEFKPFQWVNNFFIRQRLVLISMFAGFHAVFIEPISGTFKKISYKSMTYKKMGEKNE